MVESLIKIPGTKKKKKRKEKAPDNCFFKCLIVVTIAITTIIMINTFTQTISEKKITFI